MKMEASIKEGGGPITNNLQSSPNIKEIQTPSFINDIRYGREETLGYFKISNVLEKTGESIYTFFDIKLLLIAAPDWTDDFKKKAVEELGKLEGIKDDSEFDTVAGDPSKYSKCCI